MTIKEMCQQSFEICKSKGFWDTGRNDGMLIALMHSELSEALEAIRMGNWNGQNGVAEEMADVMLRVGDFCFGHDIDLETAIKKKMEYNKTRPYKHGGKKF